MWEKFWEYVGQSVWSKAGGGKVSTTRIQSYLILASVLISTTLFLSIDLVNAIIQWKTGKSYTVPTEHITLFGMVLAHHLALLGINKNSENKQMANQTPAANQEQKQEPQPEKKEDTKDEPPVQKDDTLDEEGEVH
jgi:hypothetical protein